ncbi:MAG: hypothetical protein SFV51_24800 [Bryobacteraceae bacterium]|nr:hypothetical protein [Bryobacteraceae bacterium]
MTESHLENGFTAKDIQKILDDRVASSTHGHIQKALRDLGMTDSMNQATRTLRRYVAAGAEGRRQILRDQLQACYFPNARRAPALVEMERRLRARFDGKTADKAISFFSGAAKWAELYTQPDGEPERHRSTATLHESSAAAIRMVCEGELLDLPDEVLAIVKKIILLFAALDKEPDCRAEIRAALDLLARQVERAPHGMRQMLEAMEKAAPPPPRKGPQGLAQPIPRKMATR